MRSNALSVQTVTKVSSGFVAMAVTLLVSLSLMCRPAIAQDKRHLGPNETLILAGPTVWNLDNLTAENGSAIVTNGHPLTIVVKNRLQIDGTLTIQSFRKNVLPVPTKAQNGSQGTSFDPGPASSGPSPSATGATGGNGSPGFPGSPGKDGQDAGQISITLIGSATGKLVILNNGEDGGHGGRGGNGGNGGTGQQGGRATPNKVLGIVVGCDSGPGYGGNGGNGGRAGDGGDGGAGGSGGTISLLATGDTTGLSVEYSVMRGQDGERGEPGEPGLGGHPGFGGRGATGCEGRETERMGLHGKLGEKSRPVQKEKKASSDGKLEASGNFAIIKR